MKFFGALTIAFLLMSTIATAAGQEIDIGVNGMVCAFCAQGIEKKFHAEPSVDEVKVSLRDKIVKLKLKEGQQLDDVTIRKILANAGYSVQKIERK